MAATAIVTVIGSVTGAPVGTKSFGATITSTAAVDQITETKLLSGDNTISVPTGATGVLIFPPVGNATTLKLKGAAGDTGVKISGTNPTLLTLDVTQTSFIVNSSADTTAATEFSFF